MMSNKNINLRAIEKSDLNLIQAWRNSETIQPFVREYRELSMIHINEWYDSIILDPKFIFFIIEDAKKIPIGITGLTYIDWVNRHADLHLGIYEMQWGDIELGTVIIDTMLNHGFNTLGLNKIYAEVYENDINKIDLFNKNKFSKDADLREHYFHKGKYISSYIFSILKSSYKTNLI